MNQPNKLLKLGLTPRKTALTAVLFVVWVIVLVAQLVPGSSSPETTLEKRPATRSAPPEGKAGVHKAAPSAAAPADPVPRRARQWPQMTLDEVRAYNPFGVPAAMAARATQQIGPGAPHSLATGAPDSAEPSDRRKQFLAELRREGVNLVLLSDEHEIARIGGRTLELGDRIEGFQVEEIRPDGVVLVEEESP
jgi:hypothetical protein